jgi:tetratricopeptide (TPR) repeat protein
MAALRRYQALRPAETNPLDSQGDANLVVGHLREAEDFYLQAAKKDPKNAAAASLELFKASMARLMTGDVAGADALAKQYQDARAAAHDAAAPYRAALWDCISGRRQQASQELLAFAQSMEKGPQHEAAARAYTDLALWSLYSGDRNAAAAMLQKAMPVAGPSTAGSLIVARFLAQPPASPAEWTARADQLFRNPAQEAVRDLVVAYALLLNRQFEPASHLLQKVYESGAGDDEGIPVMLAWTWLETGREKEAAALLRFNPIPPATGLGSFTPFYFPRLYQLRALAAEKEGRKDDAQANTALYNKLAGR